MFNMERPLPVGLFQTVQAFAVNCYNLLQCSLFHSKQPTCSPTVNLVSEWVRWFINHHPKGPQNQLKAKWVQPLEYLSTSSPFFLDLPIETKKTSIKWFPKIWVLKDLGSVIKESFHDVLSVQTHQLPPWHQSVAYSTGWFCWSPGWIPYQRRKPQKFQILTTYGLSDVFFVSMTQGAKYHPARTPASWSTKRWLFVLAGFFTINFHQPIYLSNISSNISPLPSFKTKKTFISRSRPVQVQWDSWNPPRQWAWRA